MISLKNTLKLLVSFFLLMVSASQADTSMTYIHTDHLGSPIAATDEAGQVKWTEEYQPFGVQRTNQDSDNNTGFTGHQYDDELELTYMQARWYHPEVGRFMALDPLLYRDVYSFNRYVYANDNPYKYIDPDGRDNWAAYTAHSRATGKSIVELDKCNGCAGAGMTLFPGMGLKDAYDSAEAGEWAEAGLNIATEMPWFKAAKLGKVDKWSRDPKSIQDQMTLDAAKRGDGIVKIKNLEDPKYKGMQKMELETISSGGKKSNVHYVKDKDGNTMDFKFKKHSTDYIHKYEKVREGGKR